MDFRVILNSKEGTKFSLGSKAAQRSELIRNMIEYGGMREADAFAHINVESDVLKKIVDFLELHAEDTSTQEQFCARLDTNDIEAVDIKFIDLDKKLLLDVYKASFYLGIDILIDLCAWKIAQVFIKGRTVTQITQEFETEVDYTAKTMNVRDRDQYPRMPD